MNCRKVRVSLDRRLQVLREIEQNPRISQRRIAKGMDLSLGTINGMMQRLEEDALIVSNHINGKITEYLITEEGYSLKAELSKSEAVHCYQFIGEMKSLIKKNMESIIESGIKAFIFYGEEDEIFRLVKMTFFDLKRFHQITYGVTQQEPESEEEMQIILWDNALKTRNDMRHILEPWI